MSIYAPELSDAQWRQLPVKERALRRAAYFCDALRVREDAPHNNRSSIIDEWTRMCFADLGSPWCGIMVSAQLLQSGADRAKLPDILASTRSWKLWAVQRGRVTTNPTRGDVFVLRFTETTGHMGFFVGKTTPWLFRTIEGNTNDDGSREGYEMARRVRAFKAPNLTFVSLDGIS